jgi:hypothetical protein
MTEFGNSTQRHHFSSPTSRSSMASLGPGVVDNSRIANLGRRDRYDRQSGHACGFSRGFT